MSYDILYRLVTEKLSKELTEKLYYHGLHHTLDVINAVVEIAIMEKVSAEELELLKITALFHDVGFCFQYHNNERLGADFAKSELTKISYAKDKIKIIEELILSTRVHSQPTNHLEEILSDADFDNFGRDDFHSISETLKMELNSNGFAYNEEQWDKVQFDFLTKHKYYTSTAKKTRLPKKLDNLADIKNRLAAY